MPLSTIALLAFASFCAGTVDAVAGGGGLVTVPALLAAGLPVQNVIATNKGQSTWGSFASMVAYWRAGKVDTAQARWTFPLGAVGALAGASLAVRVPPAVLRPLVIALLIGAAVLLAVKKPMRVADVPAPRHAAVAVLAFVVGAYDGFFGPGTGTFLMAGFVALCGRSLLHATADAKVVNFAANLASLTFYASRSLVLWAVALPMAAGQLLGGVLGARIALSGGARVVRIGVLVVSGALIAKLALELLRA